MKPTKRMELIAEHCGEIVDHAAQLARDASAVPEEVKIWRRAVALYAELERNLRAMKGAPGGLVLDRCYSAKAKALKAMREGDVAALITALEEALA